MVNDLINDGEITGVSDLTYHEGAIQGRIAEGGMNLTTEALSVLGELDYEIYIEGNVIRFVL